MLTLHFYDIGNNEGENETTPVIGILTMPIAKIYPDYFSIINTSYISWIKQTGLRWMPINVFGSQEYIKKRLGEVNGVLLPGSHSVDISNTNNDNLSKKMLNNNKHYKKAFKLILNHAIKENDEGNVFVVFGTCFGLQALLRLTFDFKGKMDILEDMNKNMPIYFTDNANKSVNLSLVLNENDLKRFNGVKIAAANHFGFSLDTFNSSERLKEEFTILATAFNQNNIEHVALVEHKDYPFIACQFHLEKSQFVHLTELNINRSDLSIEFGIKMAFMIRELLRHEKNEINNKYINTTKSRFFYTVLGKTEETLVLPSTSYQNYMKDTNTNMMFSSKEIKHAVGVESSYRSFFY